MEEIEYKLNSSSVILITEAIDRLLQLVMVSPLEDDQLEEVNQPLTYLKEKCLSGNIVVSLTAGRAFSSLVTQGNLKPSSAMSMAMAMMPATKNSAAITSIISGIVKVLVEQQIEENKDNGFRNWALTSPLHPLVMVLNQHPSAVEDIISQMESLCIYNPKILPHSIEVSRPVFLWILCDPNETQSPLTYQKAISALKGLENCPKHMELALECLIWQQKTHPLKRVNFLSTYLLNTAVNMKNDDLVHALLILMADLVVETIACGEDPRSYINQINTYVNYSRMEICADLLLAILAEAVLICPTAYSFELTKLCDNIMKLSGSFTSVFILGSSFLQWLFHPTSFAKDFNNLAKSLVNCISKQFSNGNSVLTNQTVKLNGNNFLCYFKQTNNRIFRYMELLLNFQKIASTDDLFNLWIDKLNSGTSVEAKYQLIPFFCGVLLSKCSEFHIDKIKILKIIENLCDSKKEIASGILPVLLNCLSTEHIYSTELLRQTMNPNETKAFLETIVHLAIAKENVPLIVQVIEGLKPQKLLPKSFIIKLYNQLVEKQTRCYPYLQEFLLEPPGSAGGGDSEWEVLTAKAYAIKFLANERSANFGAEMVPIISGLLTRCTDTNSSAAYCLALEALKGLWDNRVVAPSSTWKALAPKIGKDKRIAVQIGVCKLLGDIPLMETKGPDYDTLVSTALSKLWSYAVDSHNPEVSVAAFNALGNFKVQDMTLKGIPLIYRKGVQLPPEFCKTPSDAARKPEDVLTYVPGECWVNLFKCSNQDALTGVSNFCHKQIINEIQEYRSGVYAQTDGHGSRGEPQSVTYLPASSVVRGLMEYVRKEALNPSYDCLESSFLECLRCLSRRLPGPLPPMVWNFLSELWVRGPQYKSTILRLAAQQAPVSPSCYKFLINYLPCLDITVEKGEEIQTFLESLPVLCTTVEAEYLKDSLEKLFVLSINSPVCMCIHVYGVDVKLFTEFTKSLKQCLKSEKVLDDNKTMISNLIECHYEDIDVDGELWLHFADLCSELSQEYLDRVTSPTSWWEVTSVALRKAITVRTLLALSSPNSTGIVWLNEVIDACVTMPREHTFMLQKLYQVLVKNTKGFEEWLVQLMARTQFHMVESSACENSVMFLCDVVILSVIVSSNYHVYTWGGGDTLSTSRAARLTLFPQALHFLLFKSNSNILTNSTGQIMDWLHHTRSSKLIQSQYAQCFFLALVSCKSSSHMKRQICWTKCISVEPCFNIK